MIILTGAAGFIGTNMLIELNNAGCDDVLVVDEVKQTTKWQHLVGLGFRDYLHKDDLWQWLDRNPNTGLDGVVHLGACSDTREPDFDFLVRNNVQYSQRLWQLCSQRGVPFIYASSAATYGDGKNGFSDDHNLIAKLRPINAYGYSKHMFDLWAIRQKECPPNWAGLKFFNVYGPFEDQKVGMASVIYHAYRQIQENGNVKLFKSYIPEFKHGEQLRDFIYVKDVVAAVKFFLDARVDSGLYNLGTGQARTFYDLASSVFAALDKPVNIEYIDMPQDVRAHYQYFTQADVSKLREFGFVKEFTSLEDGVQEYVTSLLANDLAEFSLPRGVFEVP